MPQLDASHYVSQIFWLVIFFGLLYAFVCYYFVPKLGKVIEARDAYINGNLVKIAAMRNEIETILEECAAEVRHAESRAMSIITESKRSVFKEIQEQRAIFRQKLELMFKESEARMEGAKARLGDDKVIIIKRCSKLFLHSCGYSSDV
jgi:F-type H+-transporting ATPase subunit b